MDLLPVMAAATPSETDVAMVNEVDELPVGTKVTAANARFTSAIKPDKDVYQVTITGPKDAAPSQHKLRLVAYGEFKGSGQVLPLELPLVVAE